MHRRSPLPLRSGCPQVWVIVTFVCVSVWYDGSAQALKTTEISAFTTLTSTSTVSTYTTGDGCPAIQKCLSHPNCSTCIHSIDSVGVYKSIPQFLESTLPETKQAQLRFIGALLQTPQCRALDIPATLFFDVLTEAVSSNPCTQTVGSVLGPCSLPLYVCFAHDDCQRCLRALYPALSGSVSTRNTATTLQSAECEALSLNGKYGITSNNPILGHLYECGAFPACSAFKQYCNQSARCLRCIEMLTMGFGKEAAELCSTQEVGADGWILDGIMAYCGSTAQMELVTEFWISRCTVDQGHDCAQCLLSISSSSDTVEAAATLWKTPTCRPVRSWPELANLIVSLRPCSRAIVVCFVKNDLCAQCILNRSTTGGCNSLLADVHTACRLCPSSIQTTNAIVLLTSAIGGLSVLACLWACIALIAHRQTEMVRDRILLGLFLANMLYSVSNAFPLGLLTNQRGRCGELALPLATIRSGRAIWFTGKYLLLGYEFFMIFASSVVLRSQSHNISRFLEIGLHCCATFLGATALACFYLKCREINRAGYNDDTLNEALGDVQWNHFSEDDDLDDDPAEPRAKSISSFSEQRDAYDRLVQRMLQVWNGLLAVVVLLWIYLQWIHRRVDKQWRAVDAQEAAAEDEDEWVLTRRSAWNIRRRARLAQRHNYANIAKPLEPYLVVFLVFAVPAVAMSTNQCQRNSEAHLQGQLESSSTERSAAHFGLCDVICECILASRSLATVFVYVMGMKRRRDFFNVCHTCRLLYSRVLAASQPEPTRESNGVELNDMQPLGSSWQIDTSDVTFDKEIGHGGFGTVWGGWWLENYVAIKVLNLQLIDDDGDIVDLHFKHDFDNECNVLHSLNHPNIVKFYGCGMTRGGNPFLLTEYVSGGSLRKFLDDSSRDVTWSWRFSIALQVALAFEYLHQIPMLHRDLKADNVLLDAHYARAVVCDLGTATWMRRERQEDEKWGFTGAIVGAESNAFGLTPVQSTQPLQSGRGSRNTESYTLFNTDHNMTRGVGTHMWMPPETFRGDESYDLKVDVYAYAMLLYELATGKLPWFEFLDLGNAERFTAINEALKSGERPPIPATVDVNKLGSGMVRVMRQCWAGDPEERPDFVSIVPAIAECLRHASRSTPPTPPTQVHTQAQYE